MDRRLAHAEIGRALGVTKNAVVGKSHRLGLKPRPSPIASRSTGNAVGARAMSRSKPQEPRRISDVIDLMAGMCRWPSGDPGEADFHFCGRPAAAGKPYCAEHWRRGLCQPLARSRAQRRLRPRPAEAATARPSDPAVRFPRIREVRHGRAVVSRRSPPGGRGATGRSRAPRQSLLAMECYLARKPRKPSRIDGRGPTRDEAHDRSGFR